MGKNNKKQKQSKQVKAPMACLMVLVPIAKIRPVFESISTSDVSQFGQCRTTLFSQEY